MKWCWSKSQMACEKECVQMEVLHSENLTTQSIVKKQDTNYPKDKVKDMGSNVHMKRRKELLRLQHIFFKPAWPWYMKIYLISGTSQTRSFQHLTQVLVTCQQPTCQNIQLATLKYIKMPWI